MDPLDEPSPRRDSGDASGVRAEALDVNSDALQWRLADALVYSLGSFPAAEQEPGHAGAQDDGSSRG